MFLHEALRTDAALVGFFARVQLFVICKVLFTGKGFVTDSADVLFGFCSRLIIRMFSLVFFKTAWPIIGLRAEAASVRLLRCAPMSGSLVSQQATMSGKATRTKATEVFRYVCVCSLVCVKVTLLCVAFGAEPAGIALFTSVDALLHVDIFSARKAFLTSAIWFFGMLRSFVKVEFPFTSEAQETGRATIALPTQPPCHITGVISSFVHFQRGSPSVAPRAEAADVPLFSRVCPQVRSEGRSLSEAPVADVALVRFLTGVHPHVEDQVPFSRKALLAHLARVGPLLFEVLFLVLAPGASPLEESRTKAAVQKLLHEVRFPVRVQVVHVKEVFVAGAALVRLLPGVRFLVGVQVVLRGKELLAVTADLRPLDQLPPVDG